MTLTRKLTASAAAIIATLGLAALAPAEAEAAAATCGAEGRLIKSYPVTSFVNGVQIASLHIYYSDKYKGTKTACLYHYGPTRGRKSLDFLKITRCDSYYGCEPLDHANMDSDRGYFKYFAGPVRVTATRYRCAQVYGSIPDPYAKYEKHGYTNVDMLADNIGCAANESFELQRY